MKVFQLIRERVHPLHALRKRRFFQAISQRFDPMIRWRLPQMPGPVYLRLLSHASLILGGATQETSIAETFVAILRNLPRENARAFWDVGANIGSYSWRCATTRLDLEIVSFEPDCKNLECLRRTSRAWRLPRHTIVPCAVAEKSGRALFRLDDITGTTGALDEGNGTFIARHYGRISRKIEVETISLDDFCAAHQPPAIVKIDIEGAELSALKGASSLLGNFDPILFVETFSRRREIFNVLEQFNYQIYDSDRRRKPDDETINIVAFKSRRFPFVAAVLGDLGYPVDRQ